MKNEKCKMPNVWEDNPYYEERRHNVQTRA